MAIYMQYGFQREYTLKWKISAENQLLFRNALHSIHGTTITERQ